MIVFSIHTTGAKWFYEQNAMVQVKRDTYHKPPLDSHWIDPTHNAQRTLRTRLLSAMLCAKGQYQLEVTINNQ